MGSGENFHEVENHQFDPNNFSTDYMVFNVTPNKAYRFRIIGAISQNFPLRLSIENHTFTAIATDSIDIEKVPELTDLWISAGERYDIVINTNKPPKAYKIKVAGYKGINQKK